MSELRLADAIKQLREEIAAAIQDGENHPIRFKPGPIEVELALELRDEGSAKGGVKFWVAELGADVKTGMVQTHKIKLSLQLVNKQGGEILISNTGSQRPA